MTIKRTNADDPDFQVLAAALEAELKIRDGDDHIQYAVLNKIDFLPHTVVAYIHNEPVGCGALRHYTDTAIEMKRVFVTSTHRGKGIATAIISLLEEWAAELDMLNVYWKPAKINRKPFSCIPKTAIWSLPILAYILTAITVSVFKSTC